MEKTKEPKDTRFEKSIWYHARTIWLFTRSDLKTVILPQTVFGISSWLSSGFTMNGADLSFSGFCLTLVRVLCWSWLNLLVENISNQRLPESVLEDAFNKPWRPLPSKRQTSDQARRLLLAAVPCAIGSGAYFGAFRETMTLLSLIWIYNDLGGANESMLWRNALNAGGLMCFSAGATAISAGSIEYELSNNAVMWLGITGLVIFTTVHAQDLPDMAGDLARGRQTVPLVYGESVARWSLGFGILAWSGICPAFWHLSLVGFVPTVMLGVTIAFRTLLQRDVASDATTWKLWCVWSATIYLLPILQGRGPVARALDGLNGYM